MKQTVRNDEFLAGVKKLMNAKIYKRTLKLVNSDPSPNGMGGGEPAAVTYLQQFFNRPINREFFVEWLKTEEFIKEMGDIMGERPMS